MAVNSEGQRSTQEGLFVIEADNSSEGSNEDVMEYLMFNQVLAVGGFAEVYLAMSVLTGQLICIKRLAQVSAGPRDSPQPPVTLVP